MTFNWTGPAREYRERTGHALMDARNFVMNHQERWREVMEEELADAAARRVPYDSIEDRIKVVLRNYEESDDEKQAAAEQALLEIAKIMKFNFKSGEAL